MRALPALAAVAAVLTAAAPASALPRRHVPAPPMLLPGEASAAAVTTDRRRWLIGAERTRAAARLARRAGAMPVVPGAWAVPTGRARELAGALRARRLLTYAEPDRLATLRQAPRSYDPYDARDPWRDLAVDPALVPPPVTADSPLIALVDAKADVTHPEFAPGAGANVRTLRGRRVRVSHGTATAAVAAAPLNGIGMVGVWPGARAVNVPLPANRISCRDSAEGVARAVRAGADVINMSYGSASYCETEFLALQQATDAGVTLVAAAGNEFDQGNPLEFPAALPHVLTVGAMTPDGKAAFFSNENAAMDLVAPGVDIVTAVPVRLDTEDRRRDGYEVLAGTSFAAPMVSAAAAWLRQERPTLTVDQVQQVIRLSASDIGSRGYDNATGFGRLDLAAALERKPTVKDKLEPNDDVEFVDGRALGTPKPYVSTGRRASLRALLDVYEDPVDVYRLRVDAGDRVRVSIRPSFGNPDLALLEGRARTYDQASARLDRSSRGDRRTDRVAWTNATGRRRTVFVAVGIPRGERTLDAGYRLTVTYA